MQKPLGAALLRALLLTGTAMSALSPQAQAASPAFLKPNTSNPTSVTFNGQNFVNQGLVGAGRLAPNLIDFRGNTLGSFSGLATVGDSWRRSGSGYTGSLLTLPDRGYNSGLTYSDYAARLNSFSIGFTPYTSSSALPQSPDSQNQLTLTQSGGFVFTDFLGAVTTGANPGNGTKVEAGFILPSPPQARWGRAR